MFEGSALVRDCRPLLPVCPRAPDGDLQLPASRNDGEEPDQGAGGTRSHLTAEQMQASAEEEWLSRNRAALAFLDGKNRSPLLITRYDDLVDHQLDEVLCRFVGRSLDLSFIEPSRRRSAPVSVGQELLDLYEELNARYEVNRSEILETTKPVPVRPTSGRTARTRIHVETNRIVNGIRWRRERVSKLLTTPRGAERRT